MNGVRKLACGVALCLLSVVASAAVYRVSPSGTGDGSSWAQAMSLAGAISTAVNGDWILMKSGRYVVTASVGVSKAIRISGGFKGTDDTTLDETDPLSLLDADRSTAFGTIMSVSAATAGMETRLERLAFKYGYARGLYKKGESDLTVDSCLFMTNGLKNSNSGKGAFVDTSSGATIIFRNSEFRGNRQEATRAANGSPNPCLSLNGGKEVRVENCDFFGNGQLNVAPGTDQDSSGSLGNIFTKGAAIYTAVKTTVTGCRFSGNCVNIRENSNSGGTIWFASGSSGSVVSNCLFYGENNRAAWNQKGSTGGCIHLALGASAQTVKVVGSTFAYNLADGIYCAAGINVGTGTLYLEDCVFGGNIINPKTAYGCNDLKVNDAGIAHVKNTVFGQDAAHSHYCTVKGVLDLGEGVAYGDPLFVTRPDEITPLILKSGDYRYFNTALSTYGKLEGIDAHLMSVTGYRTRGSATYVTADVHSPAIDAASAAAPVGAEPAPNAGRRNAGYYGGTAEASMSSLGVPVVTASDVTVEFDDLAHPTVTATIGGTTPYNATILLETFTTDPRTDPTAAAYESTVSYGRQPGASQTLVGAKQYVPDTTLYVRVTVTVPGVSPVVLVKSVTVQGNLPHYYGHGGPANVIHVRGGANEKCDGHDWSDAFPTLEEALAVAAADATKTEIWIMGTAVSTGQVTTAFNPAAAKLTIRGGFTGLEDAASARPASGCSYVDGQTYYNACILANTTGHDVEVERVAFWRMTLNGISKTGGGDLTVRDCLFLTNSTASTTDKSWTDKGVAGRCIRVTSASGAHILITNCVMRGNRQTSTGGTGGPGAALSFSGCASATVVDCLFHRNGVEMEENNSGASSGSKNGDSGSLGSTLYTTVPTTFLRCEVSASGNNIRSTWTSGGTLWFESGSQGSIVSNCLFKCNEDRGCWNYAGNYGGAIVVRFGNKTDAMTVTGSTFAYNLTDGKTAAAGMTVIKGTVNLSNCAFGGNIVPPSALEPSSDLRVKADGVVNVDHTVFGYARDLSIRSAGTLNEGDGVIFKDPLFVTSPSVISNYVKRQTSGYTYYYKIKIPDLEKVDCHLLSSAGYVTNGAPTVWLKTDGVNSPAIDAGTGDYSNEPAFNGNARNAGYYGNTAEASKTYASEEPLGFSNITVTYPDTYSRPQIAFTVTGDAGCLVNVHAVVTVGTTELVYDLPGCAAGATTTILLPEYYAKGTALSVVLTGTSSSGSVEGADHETTVKADRPVWYGHGGGEGIFHLWSGAPGRGDGSDWHNAFTKWADLVTAYNKTNGITEIWVVDTASPTAAPGTLNVTTNLVIRGGFDNTNDTVAARAPGQVSTLDARKLFGLVYVSNGAGKDVFVERLVFTRATDTGFVKSGAGNITFVDCSFVANTRDINGIYNGRGVRITGTAGVTLAAFTNCVFAGNATIGGGGYNLGYGAGGFFQNLGRVTLDGCLFVSNGVNICKGPDPNYGGDVSRGSAAYFDSAPLTARNCRFAGNHGTCRNNSYYGGGALRFLGASGGSAMTNCVLVGSFDRAGWTGTDQLGSYGGALVVQFSSAEQTLDLANCTIAYNLSDGGNCPGGLLVHSGKVTAHNSIFYGNQRNKYSKDAGIGSDVAVRSGSSFAADYCFFTDNTVESCTAADASGLVIDWDTCLTGDPGFVTPLATYLAKTAYNSSYRYHTAEHAFYADLDVHLKSSGGYWKNDGLEYKDSVETSQCLDKGDPASDCTLEPNYNGDRINMGAYGNTANASRTSFGQPELSELDVVYTNGYSRPWITVKLSLASGDPCNSDVTITCMTNGVVVASKTVANVAIGELVKYAPSVYLNAGDRLIVSVSVNAPGAEPCVDVHESDVTGERPIWAGKGGGVRVIHVREGADGLATGRDWTDAYPDLASAMVAVSPSYDEMWIAGTIVTTNATVQPSLTYAFAMRGGFDGHENAPEERLASVPYATLDFSNKVNGVKFTSTKPLTVERLRFMRATTRGFYKDGSGAVTLDSCAFVNNRGSNQVNGRGAYISCDGDTLSGTLGLVTNCVFEGNLQTDGTAGVGQGLYVANMKRIEVVDTLFLTNGAALYASVAPVVARNVQFRGNRGTASSSGVVRIDNSRGSSFAHCLWLGNDEASSGALVLNLGHAENDATVDQCTIALNHSAGASGCPGITLSQGVLNLKNSVVASNFPAKDSTVPCDLKVNGTANVTYTLFSSNDVASVAAAATLGTGVIYGDPELGTKTIDAAALILADGTRFDASRLADVVAFDGHLASRVGRIDPLTGKVIRYPRRDSPAIDAGDPAYDYANEPALPGVGSNGKRVNLGFYGNTPEASMTRAPGFYLIIR